MRSIPTGIIALVAIAACSPAVAQGARFELFPEPEVRQTATSKTASAYLIDKKGNQFWVCTVRYDFRDLTANNGDCVKLSAEIGRPSLSEAYAARAVTGSAMINPLLPVIWFVEPVSGEVQFCGIRHAGLCVRIGLP
jgi:hypothetical protein